MAIENLLNHLSCLKCGNRNNLTLLNYHKNYSYTNGGAPFYTIYKGVNTLNVPICHECLTKVKKWKIAYYLTVASFIFLGISYAIMFYYFNIIFFRNLGLEILIILSLLHFFLLLMAHGSNPRLFSKFTVHTPYVRPVSSNKWVLFKIWGAIMLSTHSVPEFTPKKIGYLTWRLPLIGGMIVLITLLLPSFIYSEGSETHLYWLMGLYAYIPGDSIDFGLPGFDIFYYVLILGVTFIIIKQSYVLRRANTSIKGPELIILSMGIFILLLFFLTAFPDLTQSYFYTINMGPALYGLLIGIILIITGPLSEHIRGKSTNLNRER